MEHIDHATPSTEQQRARFNERACHSAKTLCALAVTVERTSSLAAVAGTVVALESLATVAAKLTNKFDETRNKLVSWIKNRY